MIWWVALVNVVISPGVVWAANQARRDGEFAPMWFFCFIMLEIGCAMSSLKDVLAGLHP